MIVLRYYEDMTERETADLLGVSVGTVKSQHADAIRRLRAVAPSLVGKPDPDHLAALASVQRKAVP